MEIKSVGVIGAGQMGNGIAHVFALAGYDVLLNDVSEAALGFGGGGGGGFCCDSKRNKGEALTTVAPPSSASDPVSRARRPDRGAGGRWDSSLPVASCAELASIGDRASDDEPSGDDPSTGNRVDTDVSVTLAATWIMWPHRRHFIRRVLPATAK